MEEKPVRADAFSAVEALTAYEGGRELMCPICSARIVSIPVGMPIGSRPMGLECPTNNHHFLIYGESAEAMKKARDGLRRIASKTREDDS